MPRGYCNSPAHLRDKIINYRPQDRLPRPEILRRGSSVPQVSLEPQTQFLRGVDRPQVRGGRGQDGYSTIGLLADISILAAAVIASKILFDIEVGDYVPQEVRGDFVKSWLVPGLLGLGVGAAGVGGRNLISKAFGGVATPKEASGEAATTAIERTTFSITPPFPTAQPTPVAGLQPKVMIIPAGGAQPAGSSVKTAPMAPKPTVQIGTQVFSGEVDIVEAGQINAAEFEVELGNTLGGKYRIGKSIGKGAFGIVFEATDLSLDRRVALKANDLSGFDDPNRPEREAKAVARLDDHPNIVRIYNSHRIQIRGNPYVVIAYELLEGKDLNAVIREKAPLPVPEALRYTYETAQALAYARAEGIIHRDIKPANIFIVDMQRKKNGTTVPPGLTKTGARNFPFPTMAKVLDFGMARMIFESGASMTQQGKVLGTPSYMAPELFLTGFPRDHRQDIYSLGVVLFAALTGRPPFIGDEKNPAVVIVKACRETAPKVRSINSKVPRDVQALVEYMMVKDPNKRIDYPELLATYEKLLAKYLK